MCASGLPNRNGNIHVKAASMMALDVVDAIANFKIAHQPQERMTVRVGLNTGAVMAGVVGRKMPR